ncbi:21522_t:CDS:2 [Dentiscutata erythropus]|uniref:21522_t:CDS:1 n=1 Tax=Dentiscutata erythropus TaxID=1348616 RepID=A0A9N9AP24_9GLOM|nr:21522_t:CDS:2 [Dentiscutata erythropus]
MKHSGDEIFFTPLSSIVDTSQQFEESLNITRSIQESSVENIPIYPLEEEISEIKEVAS